MKLLRHTLVLAAFAMSLAGLAQGAHAEDTHRKVVARPAIPTQCDQSAQQVRYGPIVVGTQVQLGMHRPWRGETNWAPEMSAFVGMPATVTSLAGVDAVGCPVVRVSADGGRSFWRIRDMRLVALRPTPIPPSDPIPRACGMRTGHAHFGAIAQGTSVVLGAHRPAGPGDDQNWHMAMYAFVGSTATVISLGDVDGYGCPVVHVSVDGGQHSWRIRDMQIPGSTHPLPPVPPPSPPPGRTIPSSCGVRSGAEQYGPLRPGSTVVLGAHATDVGDANWSPEMSRWVGTQTTITSLSGVDGQGCPTVRVAADGGRFAWRIRHMTFVF